MTGSVLIVDGDRAFAEASQTALEARGVTVHWSDDASLELIKKLRPTVMVLAVELPRGPSTGFSICSRVRRDRELKALPILLTSAEASIDALKKHAASTDRADDYARKPVPVDDVVARVSRLIASAPPPDPPRNGEAGTIDDPSLDQEMSARAPLLADPDGRPAEAAAEAPRGAGLTAPAAPGGPPALPSRSVTSHDQRPGPPPLKRDTAPPPAAQALDDVWRPLRLEDALKTGLEVPEPVAPAKPTPEERLNYLRQLVRHYESKDRLVRELWDRTQVQGGELARRAAALAAELTQRDKRLEDVLQDRDQTLRRLHVAETEFKAFQDEITRIFRDKDTEEQAMYSRLTELGETAARLGKELEASKKQNEDDKRRLELFQEQLAELETEQEAAGARINELAESLAKAEQSAAELGQRLALSESVATERAEEVEQLREKLDGVAIAADQERQRLVQAHAEAMEEERSRAEVERTRLLAEHTALVEAQGEEHRAELSFAEEQRAAELSGEKARAQELLETLTQTHEAEIRALEGERDAFNTRSAELTQALKALEQKLRAAEAAHQAEAEQLRADVDGLERARTDLEQELEQSSRAIATLTSERDLALEQTGRLSEQVESTGDKLAALSVTLEEERLESQRRIQELSETLERERLELSDRVADLEEELEGVQNESFERLNELEKLRKTQERLAAKAQNLETSLKISEKALGASEHRGKGLDEEAEKLRKEAGELRTQNAALEKQQLRLEDAQRDAAQMLERERERYTRAEDLLLKAREKMAELQRQLEQLSARGKGELEEAVRAERGRVKGLEDELEGVRQQLSRRDLAFQDKEAELADAYARLTEREAQLEQLASDRVQAAVKIEAELSESKAELEDLRFREGDALRRLEAALAEVKTLEETERALLREIDRREERLAEVEGLLAEGSGARDRQEQALAAARALADSVTAERDDLKDRHNQMMLRIVRALGAGLDVLRRPEQEGTVQADKTGELPREPAEYTGDVVPLDPLEDAAGVPRPLPTTVLTPDLDLAAALKAAQGPEKSRKGPPPLVPDSKATPTSVGALPGARPAVGGPEPFAALVAELHAAAAAQDASSKAARAARQERPAESAMEREVARGFDEAFALEPTTADAPALRPEPQKRNRPKPLKRPVPPPGAGPRKGGSAADGGPWSTSEQQALDNLAELLSQSSSKPLPVDAPEEAEADDRNVTEVIHLDELK